MKKKHRKRKTDHEKNGEMYKESLRDIRKKVLIRNNNSKFYQRRKEEKKTRIISKIEYGNIKRNRSTGIVNKSEDVWKIREGKGIVINTSIF